MRRFLIFSLCICALAGVSSFAHAQSIEQILSAARAFDPQYASADASVRAAEEAVFGSRSALGPRVSASAATNRTTQDSVSSVNQAQASREQIDDKNYQLQARLSLINAKNWYNISQSQARLRIAQHQLKQAEQELLQRVGQAWMEWLQAHRLVNVTQQIQEAWEQAVKETSLRFKKGEGTVQDREQAMAQLELAKVNTHDAQTRELMMRNRLTAMTGLKDFQPPKSFNLTMSKLPIGFSLDKDWIEAMKQTNPEYLANYEGVEVAKYEREKNFSDHLPTVDAWGSYYRGPDKGFTSGAKNEVTRYGLQMNIPLFASGAISSAVSQAEALYVKSLADLRNSEQKLTMHGLDAYQSWGVLRQRLPAIQKTVEANQLRLKAMSKGLKAGIQSRAEVAGIQRELLTSERDLLQVQLDLANTWLRLHALYGKATDESLLALERALK